MDENYMNDLKELQETSLKPTEIMADTSGTSYLIFGLFLYAISTSSNNSLGDCSGSNNAF